MLIQAGKLYILLFTVLEFYAELMYYVFSIPQCNSASAKIADRSMPVIADVSAAQKARLNAHMHSLFKMLDKSRGGTPIGMSWQEVGVHHI